MTAAGVPGLPLAHFFAHAHARVIHWLEQGRRGTGKRGDKGDKEEERGALRSSVAQQYTGGNLEGTGIACSHTHPLEYPCQ